MSRPIEKTVLQAVSVIGFFLCVAVALWGWQTGVLTSQERLEALVSSLGAAGALLFTVFQAVQVVVPVLPGGLGCLVGVILFGPVWGFVYNYVGICIGSLLAFAVAKNCGRPCCTCCSLRRPLKIRRVDREAGPLCQALLLVHLPAHRPGRFPLLLGGHHHHELEAVHRHHPPGKALQHRPVQHGAGGPVEGALPRLLKNLPS